MNQKTFRFARAADFVRREQNPRARPRRRDAGPVHLGQRRAHFAGSAGAGGGFRARKLHARRRGQRRAQPDRAESARRNCSAPSATTTRRRQLKKLLAEQKIGCAGLVANPARHTSVKTRIVAHKQQVVRIDRETRDGLDAKLTAKLIAGVEGETAEDRRRHRRRLRQGRGHAAVAERNQIALPRARRLVEPRPQTGSSVES